MKKIIIAFLLLIGIAACHENIDVPTTVPTVDTVSSVKLPVADTAIPKPGILRYFETTLTLVKVDSNSESAIESTRCLVIAETPEEAKKKIEYYLTTVKGLYEIGLITESKINLVLQ